MARSDPQVNFRIPADLNDKIKSAAAENNRTITAELVSRLEASFQPISVARPAEVEDLVTRVLDKTMDRLETSGWRFSKGSSTPAPNRLTGKKK